MTVRVGLLSKSIALQSDLLNPLLLTLAANNSLLIANYLIKIFSPK